MKMQKLWLTLGTVAVLALGGVGRVAWRAHRGLITLDVRETPLREVLRQIEWQTWTRLRAEKALDARITLRVKDKPLDFVLNRICEQAGARWSTLYAVYRSPRALHQLNAVLQGDGQLEPAGWTQVAPKAPEHDVPDANGDPGGPLVGPNTTGPGPMTRGPGRVMFRRTPDGQVFVSAGGKNFTENWSPEELVMESSLAGLLAGQDPAKPSAAAAAETARKVGGKWTRCVALKKSLLGIGFDTPSTPGRGGAFHRNPNQRFARLTPEQRVQQARQSFSLQGPPHD